MMVYYITNRRLVPDQVTISLDSSVATMIITFGVGLNRANISSLPYRYSASLYLPPNEGEGGGEVIEPPDDSCLSHSGPNLSVAVIFFYKILSIKVNNIFDYEDRLELKLHKIDQNGLT